MKVPEKSSLIREGVGIVDTKNDGGKNRVNSRNKLMGMELGKVEKQIGYIFGT